MCTVYWFLMVKQVRQHHLRVFAWGLGIATVMGGVLVMMGPSESLEADFMSEPAQWAIVLASSTIASTCKYLVIAWTAAKWPIDNLSLIHI